MSQFSLRQRMASFAPAGHGVLLLLRETHNAWIHSAATLLVIGGAWWLEVSRIDWLVLLLTLALVWLAEALNSALEYLCDAAVPEQHPLIGKAKDVAAGAVLIVAVFALVIGALVFPPYL